MKLDFKYKIRWSLITVCLLAVSTVFVFQNCSPLQSGLSTESSQAQIFSVIDGLCDTGVNTCRAGQLLNTADSSTHNLWLCRGLDGGEDDSCSAPFNATDPLPGICGTVNNDCQQGVLDNIADSNTEYLWTCKGVNGGQQADCRLPIPATPVNGVCNNSVKDGCSSGDFSDLTDTTSHYIWKCTGKNSGTDSPNCSYPKPVGPTPPTLTCTLSAPAITHFEDNYTYTVTTGGKSIPSKVTIYIYGTKANLDGTNKRIDATGPGGAFPQGASNINTPVSITMQNTAGTIAGLYTRSFGIVDPATGVELCRTNEITQRLTPACQLAASPASVAAEDPDARITYTVTLPKAGEVALGTAPATASFFGTKNGVVAPTGVVDLAVTRFPLTDGPYPASTVGNYTRYLVVKNSSGQEICKTNTVSVAITPAQPPPPSCQLTVQSLSHFGDSYSYRVSSPNVALPAKVNVNVYGTKANLDGSNVVTDATGPGGLRPQVIGTFNTPLQIDMVNYGGSQAGLYTRSFGIVDPATKKEVCRTNTITQKLTPSCGLTIAPSFVMVGPTATDRVTYTLALPNAGEINLGATPNNVVFYGTKTVNGVTTNDETGTVVAPVSTFPHTDGPFLSRTLAGTYSRYFMVRDAGNNELCKTSTATVTFVAQPIIREPDLDNKEP